MDATGGGDVEAPKDPGALKSHPSLTDNEIQGEWCSLPTTVVLYIVGGI